MSGLNSNKAKEKCLNMIRKAKEVLNQQFSETLLKPEINAFFYYNEILRNQNQTR